MFLKKTAGKILLLAMLCMLINFVETLMVYVEKVCRRM